MTPVLTTKAGNIGRCFQTESGRPGSPSPCRLTCNAHQEMVVYQSRFWQQGRQAAEVTPCRPQTVPAVSAKDPLQDTAQPSSQVGGTFVKRPDNQRNERKKVRNSSMNTKVREEGGGEGAPGTRADTPLQPVEKTTLEQISTPRPGEEPTPERLGIS
ncbi:uncharacterized protein LOC143159361 isoform X2 [Aptenodytes patagonicus]|uniref:uncharacterized protein LOC143159361 isoform X2 n=1 Tax=Aptenodytes patagonicus TaxID=9234 RepID=UPI003FA08DDB